MRTLNKKLLVIVLSGFMVIGSGFRMNSNASSYPALQNPTTSVAKNKTATIYISKSEINRYYPADLNKYKSIVNGIASLIPSKLIKSCVTLSYSSANIACQGRTLQINAVKNKIAAGKAKGMKITITQNSSSYPVANMTISSY